MATPSSPAFLQPQNLGREAKASEASAAAAPEKIGKGSPRGLLLTTLCLLLAGIGAGSFFYWRHHAGAHHSRPASVARSTSGATAAEAVLAPTVDMPLDPFVVNLADTGGRSYARVGLTLQLIAPSANGKGGKKEAGAGDNSGLRDMLRDTIITVLNQEQSANLLAPGGKEHLKQAIETAVTKRDPRVKIADVYFTEFLIQP